MGGKLLHENAISLTKLIKYNLIVFPNKSKANTITNQSKGLLSCNNASFTAHNAVNL